MSPQVARDTRVAPSWCAARIAGIFGMGEQFSCAVTAGNVRCWGRDNGYGSLGDGKQRGSNFTNG